MSLYGKHYYKHCVLGGAPGYGKTTLTVYLRMSVFFLAVDMVEPRCIYNKARTPSPFVFVVPKTLQVI